AIHAHKKKETFESHFLHLWQQCLEKYCNEVNKSVLISQENLITQPHLEIARLATGLEIELTEIEIAQLLKQHPIEKQNTEEWQKILDSQQCLLIETLLSPLLLKFDYETESSLSQRLDQHLQSIQLESLLMQIDKIVSQIRNLKTELREQFYESIDKHLVTTLTARECLQEAAEVCHLLGTVLIKNDLQASEKWYLRALSIQPQLAKSHYNLGFIYEEQDEWE
ncbi:MAG: tetratricopeptide repeat protein, partial [Sphaerospermopsis kisseleviana]